MYCGIYFETGYVTIIGAGSVGAALKLQAWACVMKYKKKVCLEMKRKCLSQCGAEKISQIIN